VILPLPTAAAPARARARHHLDMGHALSEPSRPPVVLPHAPPRRRIALRRSRGPCPSCRRPLVQRAAGTVDVDECGACGGIFVEAIELTRLVLEPATAARLADSLFDRPATVPANKLRGTCPCCDDALIGRDLPRLNAGAMVCKRHGIWIDVRGLLAAAEGLAMGSLDAPTALEAVILSDDLRSSRYDALLAIARARARSERTDERLGPIELLALLLS
jgi:Zn-finger nucleic acid-binding protein